MGKSVACPALVVVSQWLRLLPVLLVTRGIALSAGKETQHQQEEEEHQKMGSCCTRGVCAVDDCYHRHYHLFIHEAVAFWSSSSSSWPAARNLNAPTTAGVVIFLLYRRPASSLGGALRVEGGHGTTTRGETQEVELTTL